MRGVTIICAGIAYLIIGCAPEPDSQTIIINCTEPTDLAVDCAPVDDMPDLCISYQSYTGIDMQCVTEADCDIPVSPCEVHQCINGICSAAWLPSGTMACGDPRLSCHHSSCCGSVDPGPVQCNNPGQCPTPSEAAPNCRKRMCWEAQCLEFTYVSDTCDAFD
jgi:hypothetical protein